MSDRARMMDSTQQAYLQALGIQQWVLRDRDSSGHAAAGKSDTTRQPDWENLQQAVAGCTLCPLHATRTQTVFGTGDRHADWMIIGEAPGAEEDRQGEPFVGRAGKLLNEMLFAAGFRRDQVYIANILKCRPPSNRDPVATEMDSCREYLDQQISLVAPRLIIAVGRIAAHGLLHTTTPVGKLRGKVHHLENSGIPVIVTYHPAYLLRSPGEKRKAWQDLKLAQSVYRGSMPAGGEHA